MIKYQFSHHLLVYILTENLEVVNSSNKLDIKSSLGLGGQTAME